MWWVPLADMCCILCADVYAVNTLSATKGKAMEKQPPRVPVPLSASEREEIQAAMNRMALRSMSDFMRYAALYVARKGSAE